MKVQFYPLQNILLNKTKQQMPNAYKINLGQSHCDTVSFGKTKATEEINEEQKYIDDYNTALRRGESIGQVLAEVSQEDKLIQKAFALALHNKHTLFNIALYCDQPKAAFEFLEFIKTQDKDTQKAFALALDHCKDTQFNVALFNKHPEAAIAFLDFVRTQDKDTQKEFAISVNHDKHTQFHYAIHKKHPEAAIAFLEFAAEVAPEEVIKWHMTQKIQEIPQFNNIIIQIASNKSLTKQEKMDFLNKCHYVKDIERIKKVVDKFTD